MRGEIRCRARVLEKRIDAIRARCERRRIIPQAKQTATQE